VSESARRDYHACQLDGDLLFVVGYHIHACQLDSDVIEATVSHVCQLDCGAVDVSLYN
ncbi:21472_t:CDS:2, partial [Gigaspora rosea]